MSTTPPDDHQSLQYTLEYGGAIIKLIVCLGPRLELYINGIARSSHDKSSDEKSLDGSSDVTLSVSSTVQTDYEWHEFIEATASFDKTSVSLVVKANNAEIANEQLKLDSMRGTN